MKAIIIFFIYTAMMGFFVFGLHFAGHDHSKDIHVKNFTHEAPK